MDNLNLTVGDLLTHGTFLINETPEYWVWLTRDGDLMYTTMEMKPHVLQALLDQNRQEANDFNYSGSHGSMVKVASIPEILYYQWQREGITDDPEAMRRRLNDPNFSKFRTNSWRL